MKSSRKIDVSKSSLVSLKAELSRKQDEVNKAKVQRAYIHTVPIPEKQTLWTKKNAGVTEREEKDLEQQKEEEDILKKSRVVLETKSKMYDKLSHESSTDDNRFLVNFQQKVREEAKEECPASPEYSNPSDLEEDWVDYVDCLGRTRKCLKEDLAYIKEKDSELFKSLGGVEENLQNKGDGQAIKEDMAPELLSANMRQEMMRQKWEEQEKLMRNKTDIHYQDVLFNEARNHGVGYYSFSQDETIRKAQQESLSKLRQETETLQEVNKDVRERRRKQMEARLKAARNRKREYMGLPPENEEGGEPEVKEESKEKEESNPVKELNPEPKPGTTKPPKVRPWDIGKKGVREAMSQEEWIRKKRTERPEEFAPPSTYRSDFVAFPEQHTKSKPTLFFSTKKPSTIQRNENDFESPLHKIQKLETSSDYHMPTSDIILQDYIKIHGKGREIPSRDDFEYQKEPSGSEIQEDTNERGKGPEIPPPPTFDYYGPSSSTMRKNRPKTNNLESAIDAGLKFLRQQSEEKQNMRDKGLLEII